MTSDEGDDIKGSPMISNIQFGNKNKSYTGLVDSGSDVSLLNWNVFQSIPRKNIHFWKKKITPLNSASGHNIASLGKARIVMVIRGVQYIANFILVRNFKFDVLIGSDFIYEHKGKIDFESNTMIIKNRVIVLRNKRELPGCNLLETLGRQQIEPYSISHLKVQPRNRSYNKSNGCCIITPLNTSILFENQPGLMSHSISVNKDRGPYILPIVNNTGHTFKVKDKLIVAFIEQFSNMDKARQMSTQVYGDNSKYLQTDSRKTSTDIYNLNTSSKVGHSYNIGLDISSTQSKSLITLLNKNNNLFVDNMKDLTQTNILQATFDTGGSPPIKQRPYKNPLARQHKLDEQINEMLEAGIVSPSSSPWSSPVVIVPKRDGTQRICIDYRKINQVLVKDSHPLPRIDDIFATLGNSKYFSTLDLKSGYHQISVAPKDREKTAFCTSTSLYEFNRLPFGLASGPGIFMRMISRALHGILGKFAMAYLDDILIFSPSFESHLNHIDEVFKRLKSANLCLNKKKCHFVKPEIEYLGHILSPNGIKPNPEKVRAIQNMDPPTTVKGIRSFLGLAGYYRNFIPQFSAIARPLTKLISKNARFHWGTEAQEAFEYLKQKLVEAPILGYPDVTKPYSLYTDASDYSVGGILTQDSPEGEKVICYVSHQLTPNRLHYPVIEKECFAIIYCLTKLKQYLLGADVTVYTDHAPLKSLFTAEMKNTRVQRWAILLDEYNVKIKYRQGIHNGRADMLSRLRIKPTKDEIEQSNNIVAIEQVPQPVEFINLDCDLDINEAQETDRHCRHIREVLNKNNNDSIASQYVVKDMLLYHIGKENRFETEPFLQLVIPETLKGDLIKAMHSSIGGGHVGLEKTYQKIRSKYFWPNSYKDVIEYVTTCEVCQMRMLRKQQAELQENIIPTGPMDVVGIDTVGPLVTSNNGNNYIVTVVDWYSSWVEAYPVPNKEANTIAKVLLERFIPQHGCPSKIVSDRGTEYVNTAIDLLCTELHIKRSITTPYHPAANGKTERCHRFLNDIIAKSVQHRTHSEWEEALPNALLAMRTCVNDSSKYTPYFLLYARDPVLPVDTILKPRRRYYGDDYVPTMLQRQHSAFITVKNNTKQARDNIKIQADKKAKQRKFQVGDPVFLHDPTIDVGQIKKFSSPWKPYYRIIDMITPVTARIRCQKSGESRTAHVNNLRYANINQAWDFDISNEDSNEEQSFPEQNTRKWVAPPKRRQPNRRVKMLVPDYAETDTDSNNEDREDNIPQGDDNSTSYNNVQNDNIDHDNRPSTSAESDVNYHNRTSGFDSVAGERANSPVEHVMSEPTDMMLDDVHDNGNAAKRRDSDSTINYDPVDFECGIKRVRHDSTDSPVELDDDSRQASKYARVDDSSEDDENSSSSIFND